MARTGGSNGARTAEAIRQAGEMLDKRFRAGSAIRPLSEARAWLVDNVLQQAWNQFDWGDHSGIALVAVGGYGRGELHPHSDIDLLILLGAAEHEQYRDAT